MDMGRKIWMEIEMGREVEMENIKKIIFNTEIFNIILQPPHLNNM